MTTKIARFMRPWTTIAMREGWRVAQHDVENVGLTLCSVDFCRLRPAAAINVAPKFF